MLYGRLVRRYAALEQGTGFVHAVLNRSVSRVVSLYRRAVVRELITSAIRLRSRINADRLPSGLTRVGDGRGTAGMTAGDGGWLRRSGLGALADGALADD